MQLLTANELDTVRCKLEAAAKPLEVLGGWKRRPASGTRAGQTHPSYSQDTNAVLRAVASFRAEHQASMAAVLSAVKHQTEMIERLLNLLDTGNEELRQLRAGQESLVVRVAALRRAVDSQDAWPSFAYVAEQPGGGLTRRAMEVFSQARVLRVLCDGHTPNGAHRVTDQKGRTFKMTRKWTRKAGPWLTWSLFILSVSLKAGVKAVLPGVEALIPSVDLGEGAWAKDLTKFFAAEAVKALGGGKDDTILSLLAENLVDSAQEAVNQQLEDGAGVLEATSMAAGLKDAQAAAAGAFEMLGKKASWNRTSFEDAFGLQKKVFQGTGRVAWVCATCIARLGAEVPAVQVDHINHNFP